MKRNKRVDKLMDRARETVQSNQKVKSLIRDVKNKIDRITKDSEERESFVYQLQVLIRMIRAHFQGKYQAFSMPTIIALVFSLIYFITPVDLIPDFIPALGFTDDISLVYIIFRNFADDISQFKAWEEASS